jgi:hypothetical protein
VSRKEAVTGRDVQAKAESRVDKKKDAAVGQVAAAPPPPAPLVLGANKLATSNARLQSQAQTESYAKAQSARVQQPGSAVDGAKPAEVAGVVAMEEKHQQATAPATPAPRANETVEVTGQADVAQMQKVKSLDRGQADLDALKAARGGPSAKARADTAAGASASVTGGPISSDSALVTVVPRMKAALVIAPHWRLSAEGALERSTDAGRTWQSVRVAAPSPALRSFSALDRDIWAGGAGGALYHSADNGQTWTRVTVKAGDAVLDADIVRVEFSDAQHGALMTVAGETWTTGDAGLTWSVRR